jgi:hypothetical protein
VTTDWRKDGESYVIRSAIDYSGIIYYQSDYLKEYKVIGLYWEYGEDKEISEKFSCKT